MSMHPPAVHRCQIYGDTSERCINEGTHWVPWGSDIDFHSWECDGPHLFGEVTDLKEAA